MWNREVGTDQKAATPIIISTPCRGQGAMSGRILDRDGPKCRLEILVSEAGGPGGHVGEGTRPGRGGPCVFSSASLCWLPH